MSIKSIVTNEKKLSLVSLHIDDFESVSSIACDLVDTAIFYSKKAIGCVGLACNQIGILKRIITVRFNGEWLVMVNPVITESLAGRFNGRESCLSRPGKSVKIKRFKKIKVTYTNINGSEETIRFTKFMARVVQHEIDHLNGKYI